MPPDALAYLSFLHSQAVSKGPRPRCGVRPPLLSNLTWPPTPHAHPLAPVSSPFSCLWSHQPCSKASRAGHHLQEETYLPVTAVCSPHTSCPSTLTHLHFLPMPELSHLWVFAEAGLSARNTAPRVSLESSGVVSPRKPSQPSQYGWASQALPPP